MHETEVEMEQGKMPWSVYRHNILPGLATSVSAVLLFRVIARLTGTFSALRIAPWWILGAGSFVLTALVLAIALDLRLRWGHFEDPDDVYVSWLFAGLSIAAAALHIEVALVFNAFVISLPFHAAWLALLGIPIGGVVVGIWYEEALDWTVALLLAAALLWTAGFLFLLYWAGPHLVRIGFNAWWVLAIAGLSISVLFFVLSWFGADAASLTQIPLLLAIGVPIVVVCSPVFGLGYLGYRFVAARLSLAPPEEETRPPGEPTAPSETWRDTAIERSESDRFNFQDVADVLARRVGEAEPPITVGVFGQWGSGKTSLMRLIQQALAARAGSEQRVEAIWINAWMLSSRETLWIAFLQALLSRIHSELGWYRRIQFNTRSFFQRVQWSKLSRSLLLNGYRFVLTALPIILTTLYARDASTALEEGTAVSSALAPALGGGLSSLLGLWLLVRPAVQAAREKMTLNLDEILQDRPLAEQVSQLERLRDSFDVIVQTWVGEQGRVIVFVDDLDRCAPDKIAEVFEAVKMFVGTKRTITVIGVDYGVVCKAVKRKYEMSDVGDAVEYLEKLFQVPFHLPPLQPEQIEEFIRLQYPDVPIQDPDVPSVLAYGLEPNPRKVKQILNVHRTALELANERWAAWDIEYKMDAELMAKILVIQSRFRSLYKQLRRHPHLLQQLDCWARGEAGIEEASDGKANSEASQPSADQGGAIGKDLDSIVVSEIAALDAEERAALQKMLCLGDARFDALEPSESATYVYLTSAREGLSEDARPKREERDALLGSNWDKRREPSEGKPRWTGTEYGEAPPDDDEAATRDTTLTSILARGATPEEKERIARRYARRLGMVVRREDRYTLKARLNANDCLDRLERIWGLKEARVELAQLVRVPVGPFIKGLTEGNRQLVSELRGPFRPFGDFASGILGWFEDLDPATREYEEAFLREQADAWKADPQEEWRFASAVKHRGSFFEHPPKPAPRSQEHPDAGESVPLDDFLIGRFPVTVGEYLEFLQSNRRSIDPWQAMDNANPVAGVSWQDASEFCEWLSKRTGQTFRLPTDEQWEKAARGVDGRPFPWGDSPEDHACNMQPFGIGVVVPVTTYDVDHVERGPWSRFRPGNSPYGIADALGNVWEWTRTPWSSGAGEYIVKGGSYLQELGLVQCGTSHHAKAELALPTIGFRVVMEPPKKNPLPSLEEQSRGHVEILPRSGKS